MEIWKDIPNYEWLYQVSNLWNVKSLFRYKNILKWNYDLKWYKYVVLYKNSNKKIFRVHRLVLLTFIWDNTLQVNHKNGIRDDNRLDNLEYCTASENIKHSFDKLWRKNNFQINHPNKWKNCFNNFNSKKVIQLDKKWNLINEWLSLKDAERNTWIDNWNISKCCNWKYKSAWWFIWKFNF